LQFTVALLFNLKLPGRVSGSLFRGCRLPNCTQVLITQGRAALGSRRTGSTA
jgi:hypothetical protein